MDHDDFIECEVEEESPSHIPKVERILHNWRGEEDKLWEILRQKYGRDPDHLFPLNGIDQIDHMQFAGAHGNGALESDQVKALLGTIDQSYIIELGNHVAACDGDGAYLALNKITELNVEYEQVFKSQYF